MSVYELNNSQRTLFGLEAIEPHWTRRVLVGGKHDDDLILYLDGNVIKRSIVSTADTYAEYQQHELIDGDMLLPKTPRGKPVRLTAANLNKRRALGVYVRAGRHGLIIGHFDNQNTFYNSDWENLFGQTRSPRAWLDAFLRDLPAHHADEMAAFKARPRRRQTFRAGDYFRFKLDKNRYGFGRVLLDVHRVRDRLPEQHTWRYLLGRPVLVCVFVLASAVREVPLSILKQQNSLPCGCMMDNHLFYGDYEIIAHEPPDDNERDWPLAFWQDDTHAFWQYGSHLRVMAAADFQDRASPALRRTVGRQDFALTGNTAGFAPPYANRELLRVLRGLPIDDRRGEFFQWYNDLRNPQWAAVRAELRDIFQAA